MRNDTPHGTLTFFQGVDVILLTGKITFNINMHTHNFTGLLNRVTKTTEAFQRYSTNFCNSIFSE